MAAMILACASTPPAPRPVAPAVELPRSSIAAVLLHREELGLTGAQVDALRRRDDALAREDEAIRARLASSSEPRVTPPQAAGSVPGRGGRHGSRPAASHGHAPDLLTQLDDNDTRAYLEIEQQVLTEQQRPRAQEIASAYREALYDQQHPSRAPHKAGAHAGAPER